MVYRKVKYSMTKVPSQEIFEAHPGRKKNPYISITTTSKQCTVREQQDRDARVENCPRKASQIFDTFQI